MKFSKYFTFIRGNKRKGELERKMRPINKYLYNMVEATPYIHIQLTVI